MRRTVVACALTVALGPLSAQSPADGDLDVLAVHPALVAGVGPFHRYITTESSLSARERELLILRIAALSRSEAVWQRHVPVALSAGLGRDEIVRLGNGTDGRRWTPAESALIAMADQLHATSSVDDRVWNLLAASHDRRQLMDAVFTVAHYSMWGMMLNTIGAGRGAPAAVPLPVRATTGGPAERRHTPLTAPRIPPLEPAEWTPAVRALLDPSGSGRPVAAVYRTYAQHPALYAPRQVLSEYIRTGSTLPARVREMLILRIGYLCESQYEWAAHSRAGRAAGLSGDDIARIAEGPAAMWPPDDAAVLQAVDDLFDDDRVTEATWSRLGAHFDRRQLLDLLITAGGYRMVSMSLNAFGVPLEANSEPFPTSRRYSSTPPPR